MHNTFLPKRPVIAAVRLGAVIGLICLLAAACGGRHPQSNGSGQPSTPAAPAAGSPCTTAQLDVTLDLKSAGVAAGTSVIPLDFTNVSTASCRLDGFAYVSFAASKAGHHRVGAAATADRGLTARTLLLRAGKSAHLWLRMVAAANLPASQCRPKSVAGLLVRLPGQVSALFIGHKFRTCARRVHGTDILTVEPFQAGRARSGTAQ